MADHKITVTDEELAVLETLRQRSAGRLADQVENEVPVHIEDIKPGMSQRDFERAARQVAAALKEQGY